MQVRALQSLLRTRNVLLGHHDVCPPFIPDAEGWVDWITLFPSPSTYSNSEARRAVLRSGANHLHSRKSFRCQTGPAGLSVERHRSRSHEPACMVVRSRPAGCTGPHGSEEQGCCCLCITQARKCVRYCPGAAQSSIHLSSHSPPVPLQGRVALRPQWPCTTRQLVEVCDGIHWSVRLRLWTFC